MFALESTLITHGLPAPDNLEVALGAEDDVRAGGAVPATIAVLSGELRVGLAEEELRTLTRLGPDALKLSLRDLGPALASGSSGGTTVAATAWAQGRRGSQCSPPETSATSTSGRERPGTRPLVRCRARR